MNGEEVRYLRQNIYMAASALASLLALVMVLVVDSPVQAGVLLIMATATLSFVRGIDVDGYNRRIWGTIVTWDNPPVQEQKRVVENGEEL